MGKSNENVLQRAKHKATVMAKKNAKSKTAKRAAQRATEGTSRFVRTVKRNRRFHPVNDANAK